MSSKPVTLSRREWLKINGIQILGMTFAGGFAVENGMAAESGGERTYTPLNRFPRMVQNYFVKRVRDAEWQSNRIKSKLSSKDEAEAYLREIREKIRICFGPEPEKTPLEPRITGIIERDAYNIEKLIFESRPGFPVTANVYVPKGRTFPLPGVVGTCGHSANGKAYEGYQSFAQGLARQGYVVLIYDPIGQGERLQYPNRELISRIGVGVREHLYAGNQQFLVGEFFGAWRAWDGIRALDYLLTREEVDSKKVGITGNSGGGTMTTWLCGVESRWSMAAPSCFVTTFLRNMENELPADTEQCPPKALALGLNHEDFIAAMAPKPLILLSKEKDYFDVRGTEAAYRRLRRLYRLLGAEKNIALFTGPTYHGYSQENREAMYQWFNQHTQVSNAKTEPELTIEKDETLWCTPSGQVAELNPRTVFSFTQERSKALAKSRKPLADEALKNAVVDVLKLPQTKKAPEYRILRRISARGYPKPHFTTYAVNTDPGAFAIVYRLGDEPHYSRPKKEGYRAVLYVSHRSSDAELRDEILIRELIDTEPESELYTCDVRGIGESKPNTCGDNFDNAYGNDYFYAIHSIMLDYPYTGQKTFDALRVIDWLADNGCQSVHLSAKGWGTIPAAFAALLSDRVDQVTLKNALKSYSDIAESEDYRWPLSTLLPNVLKTFDLPEIYQALQSKKLRTIEPVGANDPIA